MTAKKGAKVKPASPALAIAVLAGFLLFAYVAAAIGSIAPIDFIYDGI